MLLILVPVSCVLSSKLALLVPPESSLSVAHVFSPHTLKLVTILVELDSEAFLAVVLPISNVSAALLPSFSFYASVFLSFFFLKSHLYSLPLPSKRSDGDRFSELWRRF